MKTYSVIAFFGIAALALFATVFGSFRVVEPGQRGVRVTLGSVDQAVLDEGLHFKTPFVARIDMVNVRQVRDGFNAACYSADLQQITARVSVLYNIPEGNVVNIYQNYFGSPFAEFVRPRAEEAIKEVTASRSAERIVKDREAVKREALESLRRKVNGLVTIHDLVIENLDLSDELERAIEMKMVQEQEAARAKFAQEQARTEAETAQIRAAGEAEAIKIRGAALKENPGLVDLQIVEKWNGVAPSTIVVGGQGSEADAPASSIILPVRMR
jgi:prohibitin 2